MSNIDKAKLKDYIIFEFQRSIVNFYKRQLNIVEDIRQDHRLFVSKISTIAPRDSVKNMDYFDDKKYNYIRKKVLDSGNEICREFEEVFDYLDVKIKE